METDNTDEVVTASFRDAVTTIDKEGKRVWLYPQKPKGDLHTKRVWFSIVLLILFFAIPFIKIQEEPLLLINILERKFIIFGLVFWPQDFFLFGLAMLTFIVFIVLFTVVFGRLWCGWACPQTIFMEMVFRKIEYFIEGDANKQRQLNASAWTNEKIIRKGSKYIAFFIVSFLIANTFLAYIIGKDELFKIIQEPIDKHIGGLVAITLFTGVFYFVYAYMREQVCLVVCPYGRLQGVLLDKNSIVVAYDYLRGESRGKIKKNETRDKGDCVDCSLCVKVCPTGIDIRNGTQLECINCTACIDACDTVMDKVGFKRGLIGYASENQLTAKQPFKFTTRMMGYSLVLTVLMGAFIFALASRSDVETSILRTPGLMFQEQENNQLSNLYNYKIVNKTREQIPITLKVENLKGEIKYIGDTTLVVQKEKIKQGEFFIYIDKKQLQSRKTKLEIGVYNGATKIETIKTNFLGKTF